MQEESVRKASRKYWYLPLNEASSSLTTFRIASKSVGPFTRQVDLSRRGLPEDGVVPEQSIQWTRPSCSYSTNVGRIGAISFATSAGGFDVVMRTAGTPFLSPSAIKLWIMTSFPTYGGPTNSRFALKGIPP